MSTVLPKLRLRDTSAIVKPKILLLSDDLRMHSGIATMSREFVIGTAKYFDWVQLGAALQHPDHGKVFDVSDDVNKHAGIDDAYAKVYAHTGYGTQEVVREIFAVEKPNAILHFTDPRFWDWLYRMEHEIHTGFKVPLMYLNIWDCPPAPFWNKAAYESCDLLMNISKQTNILVKMVLGEGNYVDIDTDEPSPGDRLVCHVPHGVNPDVFYPITPDMKEYEEFVRISSQFKEANGVDFIIFWNNRNIRRKMMGDIILAYKIFCDALPEGQASRCALFMHTQMIDDNGTDIPEVVRVVCPDYKVIFNEERLPTNILNAFYNMSDICLSVASNEGHGLSSSEAVMAGIPILINTTGGLQDQVRFTDDNGNIITFTEQFTSNHAGTYKNHGEWAKVVFPSNRSLQGSPMTPYIFDDRADFNDIAVKLREWYDTAPDERKRRGLAGREWFMSEESGLSSTEMCRRMIKAMQTCLSTWHPPSRYRLAQIGSREKIKNAGIVYK